MELDAVKMEEAPDQRINWKPQPADEKRHEAYLFVLSRMGVVSGMTTSLTEVRPGRVKAISSGAR